MNYSHLLLLCFLIYFSPVSGQQAKKVNEVKSFLDSTFLDKLEYRSIGPFRGGRAAAIAGVVKEPQTFYFGATGGGVWKTTDAGNNWKNVSDKFFGGSIGAVKVSQSDPNVVYVGGGEVTVRGNVSHGNGMWKSDDAGETWKFIGLADSRHITDIHIHPNNPDVVYAAVLGHLFGPNKERGLFKSIDGGTTWKNILFVNEETGIANIDMDPKNPRILFVSSWRVKRTPYSLESGGKDCAIWKSTDAGKTWKNISKNPGMPEGPLGVTCVAISPVNSKRVFAIVEANEGGIFRSDDGGATWKRVNSERKLRQRAWYFSRLAADPENQDILYVLNVRFHRSRDGGKTYEAISTPHGDHHDIWIHPNNASLLALADDGGGQVSNDAGATWSTYLNQPTGQFYRVNTDNQVPYMIYAAQQDNTSIRIASRSKNWQGITNKDWEPTAGFESGHIVPDRSDKDLVYGGSYGGEMNWYNHRTKESRQLDVWPDNPMGEAAKDLKYRFNWNFPIATSPHDSKTIYCAANHLFKSTNKGESWEQISPDLTRNDLSKMESSGGPITKDNTSVEYYGTIFAFAESIHEAGVIWTGSDDGLIHITRDNGKTWTNITPSKKLLPEWTMINSLEIHPTEKGGLYVAATGYKQDDFAPYLLKTTDYGKTWKKIVEGIGKEHFTRVVRADPDKKGLLYAGTESGMYVSFNDGKSWKPFQGNLPIVPITDLSVKQKNLVVATQGRGLWILDDLSLIHQLDNTLLSSRFHLFQPNDAFRDGGGKGGKKTGQNPPNGLVLDFFIKEKPTDSTIARIEIYDNKQQLIKRFTVKPDDKTLKKDKSIDKLEIKNQGLNRFVWDLRYPDATKFDGIVLWGGGLKGPKAVPGAYSAKVVIEQDSSTVNFNVKSDPNLKTSKADYQAQFDFLIAIRDKLTEIHDGIRKLRAAKTQISDWKMRFDETTQKDLITTSDTIIKQLTVIEETLYQTKSKSPQDPINYPIRLNNKLSNLTSKVRGNYRPTKQAFAFQKDIVARIDEELKTLYDLFEKDIPALNAAILKSGVSPIQLDE